MIKVLEEKPVPRAQVKCYNCKSLLEYGNADLHERGYDSNQYMYSALHNYEFYCPVCGCKVPAPWIHKEEQL